MVDLDVLAKKGITCDSLKRLFTSEKRSEDLTRLIHSIQCRIQDGRNFNFGNYQIYHALDQAWDTPFRQISPTLIKALATQDPNKDDVARIARDFDLSHLITDETDQKTGKPTGKKKFSIPTFFDVMVPLVRSVVTIRTAKIAADREQNPYFKYEPLKNTAQNRARCELLNDRVQVMSTQYGYPHTGKQVILKTNLYASTLMFPQEEWHEERQVIGDSETPAIDREGLRYHLPHPTRVFYDISHPVSSFNTDTGCQFAGYWRVMRYGELRGNKKLWNNERIRFPSADYRSSNLTFFNTVYRGCVIQFPQTSEAWSKLDRENVQSTQFYTSDFDDSAVVITEYFAKLVPSEWGLGHYDHPVWFRFILATDDTVLYVAPLPGCPVLHCGYDPLDDRVMNASLALEVVPFQDMVSNLLVQTILSVKQNLANLTFVDEDLVDNEAMKKLENAGEASYRKLNFIKFLGRKIQKSQQDVRNSVHSVRFPQLDTQGTIQAIGTILNIMERVLVMSAMEVGSQATHEQSAEEVRNVAQSTSTRLQYTASYVDEFWDAWKKQIYTYLMAYGEKKVYGAISAANGMTTEDLGKMGLTVEEHATTKYGKHTVKGNKTAIQLEHFASTRDGRDRVNNIALSQAMVQALQLALSNQLMAQAIGPDQAVALMNHVIETMGLPRDFKLEAVHADPNQPNPLQEMQAQVQQQLIAVVQQVKEFVQQTQAQAGQQIMQQVAQGVAPLAEAVQKAVAQSADNATAIAKLTDILEHHHMENELNDRLNNDPFSAGGNPAMPAMAPAAGMPVG